MKVRVENICRKWMLKVGVESNCESRVESRLRGYMRSKANTENQLDVENTC